ncbi:hypothetical protein JRO89_XS05G0102000 [Xanthoceras sorbifolium]|uniref:Very-long-chain 3-oxoacyl-CoA reductase n=1 Tax=Xanthoceras sorbifolium TaxID=99658 RepID=A0ABQ8I1C2_9ROSI|nr:hypothetical protein JRO89_XS05G0102000 [Xanthoceras sorbifolium]
MLRWLSSKVEQADFELIYVILWNFWNDRNQVLHKGSGRSTRFIFNSSVAFLGEFLSTHTAFLIKPPSSPDISFDVAKWISLPPADLKLNFDVVHVGSGFFGVSAAIYDSSGFIILLKHCATFLKWVFFTFLRPPKNLHHYGSWALITGATDGIGKAFAHQLANQGLNLILVSRNHNKLKTVSNELLSQFPNLKIKIVEFDFSSDANENGGVGSIEEAVNGLEIGVLINNVGITYPRAMFFHEVEEKLWMDIVRVNLEGTTRVTRAVLSGMLMRKKGAIVNIGSGAAIVVPSHPLFAIYAATKS